MARLCKMFILEHGYKEAAQRFALPACGRAGKRLEM